MVGQTGLFLGLASGPSCLASCAPVLAPYLVAEGAGALTSARLIGRFMLGRLLGYLASGLLAGIAGSTLTAGRPHAVAFGVCYVLSSAPLVTYGLSRRAGQARCPASHRPGIARRLGARCPRLLPVLLGLATGLSLCPPFVLAVTAAAERGSVLGSIRFFLAFFLGTSLFLLPLRNSPRPRRSSLIMSSRHAVPPSPGPPSGLPIGRALLLWLPMLLLSSLMLVAGRGGVPRQPGAVIALVITLATVNTVFFLMLKTGKTDRYRAILFVTVAVTFAVSFISNLLETRGSMALSEEDLLRGRTPFCHMVIPVTLIPAALTKTIIFPGALFGPHGIAGMFVIWIGATLALGRGLCSWGCFFGGLEDGISRLRRRPVVRQIDARWTYLPYAVLGAMVILSAVSLSPTYCMWLCPFNTVSEYFPGNVLEQTVQVTVFLSLFLGLVVVLPYLSRRRTQCGLFCPMGAFQSLFNKINVFEIRIDRDRCADCGRCVRACPTFSIDTAGDLHRHAVPVARRG